MQAAEALDLTQPIDAEPESPKSLGDALGKNDKKGWKPDISCLKDAIDHTGAFLPRSGQRVVIQYPADWRDTTLWVVTTVNPETGKLILFDPIWMQHSTSNFKGCPKEGFVFKLPEAEDRRTWQPGSFANAQLPKRKKRDPK